MAEPVQSTGCCVGREVQEAAHSLEAGEVLLLENVRFHPEEEANDTEFAKALASLAELYVNDAFGTAHRAHASTEGVARLSAGGGGVLDGEGDRISRAARSRTRNGRTRRSSAGRRSARRWRCSRT